MSDFVVDDDADDDDDMEPALEDEDEPVPKRRKLRNLHRLQLKLRPLQNQTWYQHLLF